MGVANVGIYNMSCLLKSPCRAHRSCEAIDSQTLIVVKSSVTVTKMGSIRPLCTSNIDMSRQYIISFGMSEHCQKARDVKQIMCFMAHQKIKYIKINVFCDSH